jgi:hypothetical protein
MSSGSFDYGREVDPPHSRLAGKLEKNGERPALPQRNVCFGEVGYATRSYET